jgi:hypothetical protein
MIKQETVFLLMLLAVVGNETKRWVYVYIWQEGMCVCVCVKMIKKGVCVRLTMHGDIDNNGP